MGHQVRTGTGVQLGSECRLDVVGSLSVKSDVV